MNQRTADHGPSVPRSTQGSSASWLSAALLFGPLALFAEALILKTHHRPLGAATFAVIAVGLWVLAEIVTRRFLDPTVCARRATARKAAWVLSGIFSCGVLLRTLF